MVSFRIVSINRVTSASLRKPEVDIFSGDVFVISDYFVRFVTLKQMTRLYFVLFVLWTLVSVGSCKEDGGDELADKDIVKGVVEVCQPRHQ